MIPTEEELQQERHDHRLVADAMASVRLFRALFGDGEQTREWVRELVLAMYRTGHGDRHGEREPLLATAADAIARTYLGHPAHEVATHESERAARSD